MTIEWSADALADLDRFSEFLHSRYPALARVVAREIMTKVRQLSEHPDLGIAVAGRPEYRQIVMQVLNAAYILQYRIDGERLVILRIYHGREKR